jgi:hypothetical protein
MRQSAPNAVTLKIAPRRRPRAEELSRLQALGAQKLGPQAVFTVELVGRLLRATRREVQPYVREP